MNAVIGKGFHFAGRLTQHFFQPVPWVPEIKDDRLRAILDIDRRLATIDGVFKQAVGAPTAFYEIVRFLTVMGSPVGIGSTHVLMQITEAQQNKNIKAVGVLKSINEDFLHSVWHEIGDNHFALAEEFRETTQRVCIGDRRQDSSSARLEPFKSRMRAFYHDAKADDMRSIARAIGANCVGEITNYWETRKMQEIFPLELRFLRGVNSNSTRWPDTHVDPKNKKGVELKHMAAAIGNVQSLALLGAEFREAAYDEAEKFMAFHDEYIDEIGKRVLQASRQEEVYEYPACLRESQQPPGWHHWGRFMTKYGALCVGAGGY